jgi:hypothetical protein
MIGGKVAILAGGVAAGLAALMFGSSNANAASAAPKPTGRQVPNGILPPSDIISEIATATASGDPTKIRATADDVEKRGFPQQAADLRVLATELEKAMAAAQLPTQAQPVSVVVPGGGTFNPSTGVLTFPGVPPITIPLKGGVFAMPGGITYNPVTGVLSIPGATPIVPEKVPAPPLPNPLGGLNPVSPPNIQAQQPASDPARALAGRVALMLSTATRGKEDKALVTAYQAQEKARGQYSGALDGLYGPVTALTLAHDWQVVPPKPLYWPKNPTPAKNSYTAAIAAYASSDAPRAEAWAKAADVKYSGEAYDSRRHGPQNQQRRA